MTENPGLVTNFRGRFGSIFKGVFIRYRNIRTKKVMGKIGTGLDEVEKTIDKIAKIDADRVEMQKIIGNGRLFLESNTDLRTALSIKNIYLLSKKNPILFMRNLRAQRELIKRSQGELVATALNELSTTENEFGPEESFRVLISLYAIIAQKGADHSFVIGFLKTPPHPYEIYQATEHVRNKRLRLRIRKAVDILAEIEVQYLTRYLAEVESWKSGAVNLDIKVCQAVANSFFYGNEEPYLGLISRFNDEAVERFLKSNRAYLQLSRFDQQVAYLTGLLDEIESNKHGDWREFEHFYRNAKKIAKKVIAKRFGNNELAAWMLQERKKMREFRRRWVQDMKEQIARLVAERRTKVIMPFIAHMEILFRSRIDELRTMEKPEIEELRKTLEPLVGLEKKSAENILEEASLIEVRARRRMEDLRFEFDYLSNRCIAAIGLFMQAKESIVNQELRAKIYDRLRNALAFSKMGRSHMEYIQKTAGPDLEAISNDPRRIIALLFSSDKAGRAEIGVNRNLISIGSIFNKSTALKVGELQRLLNEAEEEYEYLGSFMAAKLGFLTQSLPVKAKEVNNDERTATTA